MEQKKQAYEIYYEYKFGNLHKIFFRCEHQSLYSNYDKYLITNEGRKGYYAVYSVNAFNELWYITSAKTLKEIFENYRLDYKKFKEKAEVIRCSDGAETKKI